MASRFVLLAVAALLVAGVTPARGQAFADLKSALIDYSKADLEPKKACEALGQFKSKEIAQIAATLVPAGAAAPAHCKVSGTLSPEIAFEVSLPAKWNGRFYMIGNGGHAGESLEDPGRVAQKNQALQLGFAFAQTNTGHDARKEPGGSFVMSNPQKAIDYAWRAVHLTATTSKDITRDYYGKAAAKSYWNSCSNGGRQGLIEAQRYPEDFDGYIIGAPWNFQSHSNAGFIWDAHALAAPSARIPEEMLPVIAKAAVAACDKNDGLADGIITDPSRCRFDPKSLICSGGTTSGCLTAPQATALQKIYEGPKNPRTGE